MKKFLSIAILAIITISFQSCSSVKVRDSWKSDHIGNIKDNKFLVIARTDDTQARVAFENEIVKQMQSKGLNAVASFAKFGDMQPDKKITEDSEKKAESIIKSEGFDGVVLTVLKDFEQETRVQTHGGYYAGGNYAGYYPPYYGGFYGYYYNPLSYSTMGNYVPETRTTQRSKVYILETTVYDLKESGENQLVAVITSEIDNPETASEAAKNYVKEITKSFK